MPDLFANIKKGDSVVEQIGYLESAVVAYTVTHVSPKQFEANEIRWRKDNGKPVISSMWPGRSVEPLTPESQPLLDETKARLLAQKLEPKLRTLSLGALERIAAIVDGDHA